MDYYWGDKTELSASEVVDLRNDDVKSGFYSTFIGPADAGLTAPLKNYYK